MALQRLGCYPIGPESCTTAREKRGAIEYRVDKILHARIMHIRVGRQVFLPTRIFESGAIERRQVQFALGPGNAELVALDPRMPAHVHDRAQLVLVLNHYRRRIFHREGVDNVRELTGDPRRLSKKEIQDVNAVAGDVVQRSAARLSGVQQPRAMQLCGRYLRVARRLSEHWLANHASADQFPGAMDLGICTAIVGYAQGAAAPARLRDHPFRLGQVHGQRLLAEDVPMGCECGDGLRSV